MEYTIIITLMFTLNGIETINELFKAEIWFIFKCLIIILTTFQYFNIPNKGFLNRYNWPMDRTLRQVLVWFDWVGFYDLSTI